MWHVTWPRAPNGTRAGSREVMPRRAIKSRFAEHTEPVWRLVHITPLYRPYRLHCSHFFGSHSFDLNSPSNRLWLCNYMVGNYSDKLADTEKLLAQTSKAQNANHLSIGIQPWRYNVSTMTIGTNLCNEMSNLTFRKWVLSFLAGNLVDFCELYSLILQV